MSSKTTLRHTAPEPTGEATKESSAPNARRAAPIVAKTKARTARDAASTMSSSLEAVAAPTTANEASAPPAERAVTSCAEADWVAVERHVASLTRHERAVADDFSRRSAMTYERATKHTREVDHARASMSVINTREKVSLSGVRARRACSKLGSM